MYDYKCNDFSESVRFTKGLKYLTFKPKETSKRMLNVFCQGVSLCSLLYHILFLCPRAK